MTAGFDPDTTPAAHQPPYQDFVALWDTGATGSVITHAVVHACGLKPTGMTQVNHAGGVEMQETYLVNIRLPNNVRFHSIRVTKAPLTGIQMIIGMDIIGMGDFAITNKDGLTIFTYRFPSTARTDYVKEENRVAAGTNQHTGASFPPHKKKGKR